MLSLVSVVRVNSAGRFNPEIIFESAAFKIVLFKPRSAASAFANTRCARVANLLAGVGADKLILATLYLSLPPAQHVVL
jgi:hypothetical protein